MSMYQTGFNVGNNNGVSIGDLLRGAVEQATKRETKRNGKAVLLTWQFEGTWVKDAEGYPVMKGTFKPSPHIFVNETRGTSETVVPRAKARQEYLRIWRNLADNGIVCSVHDAETFAFVVDSFEYVKTRGLQASQTVQVNGKKVGGVRTETTRTFAAVTPTMQGAFGPVMVREGNGKGTIIGIPPGPEAAQRKMVEGTPEVKQLTGDTVGAKEGEIIDATYTETTANESGDTQPDVTPNESTEETRPIKARRGKK